MDGEGGISWVWSATRVALGWLMNDLQFNPPSMWLAIWILWNCRSTNACSVRFLLLPPAGSRDWSRWQDTETFDIRLTKQSPSHENFPTTKNQETRFGEAKRVNANKIHARNSKPRICETYLIPPHPRKHPLRRQFSKVIETKTLVWGNL